MLCRMIIVVKIKVFSNCAVYINSVTNNRFSAMFNSPINPLSGVTPAGQEGHQNRQNNEESRQEKGKKNPPDNIFPAENELELYTDIINEQFDIESYIRSYFEKLRARHLDEKDKIRKIDKYLDKFDLEKFERKFGKELSREDLNVILYEKVVEFGLQ